VGRDRIGESADVGSGGRVGRSGVGLGQVGWCWVGLGQL
jgi:hypothetical protein